jgi:hypothetical protein
MNLRGLQSRIERLERRQHGNHVSLWNVIAGAVAMPIDPDQIDPRHREMLQDLMSLPDLIEDVIEPEITRLQVAFQSVCTSQPEAENTEDPNAEG